MFPRIKKVYALDSLDFAGRFVLEGGGGKKGEKKRGETYRAP